MTGLGVTAQGATGRGVTARTTLKLFLGGLCGALIVVALPAPSHAVSRQVTIRDNSFNPKELRIDPGDTVVWTNSGRNDHTVTSDNKKFSSGEMGPGDSFSHTFNTEGYFFYHCRFHGAAGRTGQWGVVIVGNPPPLKEPIAGPKDRRPRIVVPRDARTIQKAVDRAKPGTLILIRPGRYGGGVVVKTPRLTIQGVDRYRTVLHGQDKRVNGITVDGVRGVSVKNLTVRNFTGNGVYFNNSTQYKVARVDAIKNRTYGIYAYDSYDGVIRRSFGWGSGDSAFYIGQCLGCGGLIEDVYAARNFIGYSGTNATGVVIRNSRWVHNGAGLVPNTLPTEELGPNRGTFMYNNDVHRNNYSTVPAAGVSDTFNIPFGTGIWFLGVENNVARSNRITGHQRYGVLITQGIDQNSVPMNNSVLNNSIKSSGKWDLAYDGTGANNCFSGNVFTGESGPPDIETLYNCANRPFAGVPYGPVQSDVVSAIALGYTREQKEPPEPKRPKCQRGRRGCHRH